MVSSFSHFRYCAVFLERDKTECFEFFTVSTPFLWSINLDNLQLEIIHDEQLSSCIELSIIWQYLSELREISFYRFLLCLRLHTTYKQFDFPFRLRLRFFGVNFPSINFVRPSLECLKNETKLTLLCIKLLIRRTYLVQTSNFLKHNKSKSPRPSSCIILLNDTRFYFTELFHEVFQPI